MNAQSGRAWVFGDNISTDALTPGAYMKLPIEELAKHCLESVDPAFAVTVAQAIWNAPNSIVSASIPMRMSPSAPLSATNERVSAASIGTSSPGGGPGRSRPFSGATSKGCTQTSAKPALTKPTG